jgi:hypothetical protein
VSDPRSLIQVDARGRISLASVTGPEAHSYYLVDVAEDGVITLTPAVVAPINKEV